MSEDIKNYLLQQKGYIEAAMESYSLGINGPFAKHIEAMRYSLFAGGKRIRPILCLAAAQATAPSQIDQQELLPTACAIECIHTYSLIHDDLPAMDDDCLRRGKATNHVLYGEAGAILAGDSLLTWAFDLLCNPELSSISAEKQLAIAWEIARAAGPIGMVGGQHLDMDSENKEIDFKTLATIHKHKTGALITASVIAGGHAAGADDKQIAALREYGDAVGLAFQIVDDLLDATATSEELGKTAGSDAQHGKATYPAFFGVDETRKKARAAVDNALSALTIFGKEAEPLREIARYIYSRNH